MKKKILITGGNGQLGNCLKKIAPDYELNYDFRFTDSSDLDITDEAAVFDFFEEYKPHYCINAAAYTAVDLAEKEEEMAFSVNADAVAFLAEASKKLKTTFIHVSTDYVFDGETEISYSEDDFTQPSGVYGASKLKGEILAIELNPESIIVRTSWLYSEFNKNFVKTMLNLFSQKEELSVVADQFGQPTNANDLAEVLMKIISKENKTYGIFHFSNYPETSWYEFASKIAEFSKSKVKINPISTDQFPTAAKRPRRSTMDLSKIEEKYNLEIKHWEQSLEECIGILNNSK